jgi:protein phosphatase 1 regulatory subunit 7
MAPESEPMDVEESVPPPPIPVVDPSERRAAREGRRARVELPHEEEDHGPTYYRIGIDHEYSPDDDEIHFQCTRIKKLENLEAAGPRLKKLILIANCIEVIENLDSNVNLEHLELYQNLVKKIQNIQHLTKLTNLDLSFNKIRTAEPLGSCCFDQLERLYLSSNKITDVEGVFHFPQLTMLELGSNRIREIPPEIGQLTNLEQLWLGRNKIVSMALPPLPALRHLSMQNNRLESWDPALFRNCSGLTYLYLGHNNLPDLPEEFALLTELKELDLAKNAIKTIRWLPELAKLQELWMNDCQVEDLAEVQKLSCLTSLLTVYMERNTMHTIGDAENEARYKEAILAALPNLKQLDAVRLTHEIKVITDGTERQVHGIRKR